MKNPRCVFVISTLMMFLVVGACNQISSNNAKEISAEIEGFKSKVERLITDIAVPFGFKREVVEKERFAEYLRGQFLKKDKTVFLYNGKLKVNQRAQYAVLDVSVGNKDLQQCADAIMRLRAEWLYAHQQYKKIEFKTGSEKVLNYANWLNGKSSNKNEFMRFMEYVFSYCGTASLPYSLKQKPIAQMQIGNILLKPGYPGHAVIVMDMAYNNKGQKVYLLAQSYMPAQDIHVLKNFVNNDLNPWYELNDRSLIETPEWDFYSDQLYGWK